MSTKSTTFKKIILNAISDYRVGREWHVDARRKATREALSIGLSKDDIAKMRMKHVSRLNNRITNIEPITHAQRVRFIERVRECEYSPNAQSSRYNCTGIDWTAFHRKSSNGIGWVCIAPDEPYNNVYIEDSIIVKYLSNKFKA